MKRSLTSPLTRFIKQASFEIWVWVSSFLPWTPLRKGGGSVCSNSHHAEVSRLQRPLTGDLNLEVTNRSLRTMGNVHQLGGVGRGKHQSLQGHCICHKATVEEVEAAMHTRPHKVDGQETLGVSQIGLFQEKTLEGPLTWLRKTLQNSSQEVIWGLPW